MNPISLLRARSSSCCAAAWLALVLAAPAAAQDLTQIADPYPVPAFGQAQSTGPVRLQAPARVPALDAVAPPAAAASAPAAHVPGEFERFVQSMLPPETEIRRLGAELVTGSFDPRGDALSPVVPPDYIVAPGDEVLLVFWGSIDADLRMVVDRGGRIHVPRVGSIQVAGTRYAELPGVVQQRAARVFKNFQLSVSLGQLRGIRVFVTGFVAKPGTYTVSALSTVVGALMRAGGPSAAGSFRKVELKRDGASVARFDLYDLLLNGDRSADRLIQAGDVIHVGPVGMQIGVIGSVNRPAVVELAPTETVADALRMAGGFSAVADRSRLAVERLQQRYTQRVVELALPRDAALPLSQGDVLHAFSAAEAVSSILQQNKRVRVDGEVARPGEYVLPPASSLQDAVLAAGGLTPSAYVFGTQFTRESVRQTQQDNYDRALRDLETTLTRSASTQRVSSATQAASIEAQAAAATRLISRLRSLKPSGRVVLQVTPATVELPSLLLEDGDRLYVPPRPSAVGVFGSVFSAGSYVFAGDRTLDHYLGLAGGPTKGADVRSVFVVRANGQVISGLQRGGDGWFARDSSLGSERAEPGDTLFVPEELDKSTFIQSAIDWTQIVYQFGIGIAGIRSALN